MKAPLVTGIGSLPHTDAGQAMEFVAKTAPRAPYWPQLPRRTPNEGMIRQFLGAAVSHLEPIRGESRYRIRSEDREPFFREIETGSIGLLPAHAGGFHALLAFLRKDSLAEAELLKAQVTGPVTLGHCIRASRDPERSAAEDRAWTALVIRTAVSQVEQLAEFGRPVLVMIDEPVLQAGATASEVDRAAALITPVVAAIRGAGAEAGIHACGRPPFEAVDAIDPDWFSFDACAWLPDAAESEAARTLARRGRGFALGLVPTKPDPESLPVSLERATRSIRKLGLSASRIMVTPSCGLALASESEAAEIFARCSAMAEGLIGA